MSAQKILLIRSDIRLAGPAIVMHATAHALRDGGWNVEIASGGGALVSRFREDGFTHHEVSGLAIGDRKASMLFNGLKSIRQIVKDSDIGIVHSFNAQAGLLAWAATRGRGTKIVNTVLGAGKEWALPHMPFKLIAVSDFVKQSLESHGVKSKNIATVYNATLSEDRVVAGESEFNELWKERFARDDRHFVGVAMMNGDKGQRASIEAIARLIERFPHLNATLTLVGDGSMRAENERFARERGVQERVKFAGAQRDVDHFLDRGHVFLHLSPQETFGIVLIEANARGIPAISYDIGGIPEVIADGVTGKLVEFDHIDGVVEAMAFYAGNLEVARQMGRGGVKRAGNLFTRTAFRHNLEQVYGAL